VAVVIEVEKRNTAAHSFRQKLFSVSAIDVGKVNSGLSGNIFETCQRHLVSAPDQSYRRQY
jgi:hypothetical protein